MKFRTWRKEAKECVLWIKLLDTGSHSVLAMTRDEAHELKLIFSAIIKKLE